MSENAGHLEIKPVKIAFQEGEQISFILTNIQLSNQNSCSVDIAKVEDDYTEFAIGFGIPIISPTAELTLQSPTNAEFKSGIYILSSLSFSQSTPNGSSNELRLTPNDFGLCLFQVYRESDEILNEQELLSKYNNIMIARDQEFTSGFGNSGSKQYLGLVFVKDCLITRRMRLGKYEIIPFEGLTCNDELNLIQSFLIQASLNPLTNVSDVLTRAQQGQPTIVIYFPKIITDSVDKAGQLIEDEVRTLGDLLTIYRNSYASIFGSVLVDLQTNQSYFKILTPNYRGNLLGGSISGEDPRAVRDRMNKAKTSSTLQLYLALYKEALQETRTEFQYFRYWNLIETIARSKGYVGHPLRDWAGNILKNRQGQDRQIQDEAEPLVSELLRSELNISNQIFATGLSQGLITQMIPIWYRHRNCVVHGGGCFASDTMFCDRSKDKFINCKLAHDEIINIHGIRDDFTDGYIRALRDIVSLIISKELN